jgi:hypothetical protein
VVLSGYSGFFHHYDIAKKLLKVALNTINQSINQVTVHFPNWLSSPQLGQGKWSTDTTKL